MKDHTKSASGIHPPNELYINPLHSTYKKIIIPFEINKLISEFEGTIWRSNYRIIIKIPSDKWMQYGRGEMDTRMAHQFKQSAWIQLSQFNAEDLRKAINQTIQFEEIARDVQSWQQYCDKNQQKLLTILSWFIKQEYILSLRNGSIKKLFKFTLLNNINLILLQIQNFMTFYMIKMFMKNLK